jgi:hypothetical protein
VGELGITGERENRREGEENSQEKRSKGEDN